MSGAPSHQGSSLAMAILVLRCWDEWRMAEPFGDNQGHSDGRGAGSNRDYLVGATMIGSLSGQDCTQARDTAAGQTIPSPYAAYMHLNSVEVSHERAIRERCSR